MSATTAPTIGSLCSGYGGLDMGLTAATGGQVIWHAEVNPEASAVLTHHWPDMPNLGDIIDRDWSATERPDILCAGFPCQPVSAAGRQLATADPRWLWPAVHDAIAALSPPVVFLENVANITSILKGEIIDLITNDLHVLGYRYRWTILGACAVGAAHHRHRWFLRADRLAPGEVWSGNGGGPATCGARRGRAPTLLPTTAARDGDVRGEGDAGYWTRRRETRTNGAPLGAVVALMPTPAASDATGAAGRVREGAPDLKTAVVLLPSPRASDGERGRGNPNQHGGRGDLMIGSAVQPERFGAFAPAVARQEDAFGRPAPAPTEPNSNGNVRLSAVFAEWLMGLPAGHVTGHGLTRGAELKMIGNGVVPQQATAAWHALTRERNIPVSDASPPEPLLNEPADNPPDDALPNEPYGMETALGGMTREHLRNASPITADIRKTLEFHDSGTAVQCLRDVLFTIGRAATEASRRRPKNRPPEFAELSPPALRQLAALCRVYSMVDTIDLAPFVKSTDDPESATLTMEVGVPPVDVDDSIPLGDHPARDAVAVTLGPDLIHPESAVDRVNASIAEHERQVIAERVAAANPPFVSPTLHADPFVGPDPAVDPDGLFERVLVDLFTSPAPVDPNLWLDDGGNVVTEPDDPLTSPAPIVPAELDRLAGEQPPF